jgi:hypothetical protein
MLWIAISEVMGGLVILNMQLEQPSQITTHDQTQEKYVRIDIDAGLSDQKGLVMIWQISFDSQQKKISVYLT